jgi:hypothetical protein
VHRADEGAFAATDHAEADAITPGIISCFNHDAAPSTLHEETVDLRLVYRAAGKVIEMIHPH